MLNTNYLLNGSLTLTAGQVNPESSVSVLPEVIRRAESVRRHCHRRINDTKRDSTLDSTNSTLPPALLQREPIITPSLPSFSMFLRRLLVDNRHSIVYCDVPKVASSTVKAALAIATGRLSANISVNPSESLLRLVPVHSPKFMSSIGLRSLANPWLRRRVRTFTDRHASGDGNSLTPPSITIETEIDQIVEYFRIGRYRKFVVVRHPFDRVVSAYRDKFVRRNRYTNHFHRKYGRLIVSRYRDNQSSVRWRYLTSTNGRLVTPSSASDEVDNRGHDVTFVEFVRFLIDEAPEVKRFKINPHWQPVAELCRPCIVNYDYVVRIESFQAEMTAVWNKLLQSPNSAVTASSRSVLEKRRNSGPDVDLIDDDERPSEVKEDASNLEVNSMTITSRYTKLLSRDQLCLLAAFYREDFELFGYKLNANCSNIADRTTFEASLIM